MNEIQNQIYLYQCLKISFLCISLFCLFVTVRIYCGWKRNTRSKLLLLVLMISCMGSFVSLREVKASTEEQKPVILKMKEGSCLKYTKIYDRDDFSVFQNSETGDILENLEDIEIGGVEQGEEVFVKNLEGVLEEEIKDVTERRKTTVLLTKVELGGKDASKYKVELEKQQVGLGCELTIKKRKINLKVEQGQREYGHYNEISFASDVPVQENTESYINCETEGLLEGDAVSYPTPLEKPIGDENLPDYPLGEWTDRITVKQDGEPGKNYYFNYQEVACGSLKICPESIEDYSGYIEFETDRKQVYLDKGTGKLWVDGEMQDFHVLLKENKKTSFYTDVCTESGEIISQNGKGLDFSKEDFEEGEERKLSLFLIHRKNKVKSEPFEISVFLDGSAPEVTENTVSDRINVCEALPDTIRFSKFYGKEETGQENFCIEDESGCGVKKSWYHIMESQRDFTKELVEEYVKQELKKAEWDLLSQNGEIQFPVTEKNYLVFIKTEDYLGHEKIYVSDAIMADWEKPQLEIQFGKNQPISKTGIYGEDVDLELFVKDAKSAIAQIEVLVKGNGEELVREILFQESSLEEREKYKELILPYMVVARENNSMNVQITVHGMDYAGNKTEKELSLQTDTVLPKVEVQCFSRSDIFLGYYSKNPVIMQILYEEENFSKEKEYLWFEAEINGEKKRYSLGELEDKLANKIKWIEKDEEHILEMTLEKGEYKICPFVKDLSQRITQDCIVQGEEISLCIDRQCPIPVLELVNGKEGKDYFFNEDIKLRIGGTDKRYGNSGLKEIYYIISRGKQDEKISLFQEMEESTQDFSKEISVPVAEYGDGVLEIQVIAKDRAGNIGKSKKIKVNIDATNPKISVRWSVGKANERSCYNVRRTALIEIAEENFDTSSVKWDIEGKAKVGKWKLKGNTHYCEVIFSDDGVYRLAFTCEDKAGNQGQYKEKETFVIDGTAPVIEVSYENEGSSEIKYFNRPRVAEIVIREQNFDENQVEIITGPDSGDGKRPRITEFSSNKGVHKAKVFYEESGEYYLKVSCGDKAGNQAKDFQSESFYVDLELPKIKISNIKDKSSNKDKVEPIIEIKDLNYQMGGFAISLTGSNDKNLKIKKTVKRTKQGQKIQIADLPRTEETDDTYTLSVTAVDKAGNWAKEEIIFSVNRYGSVYEADLNTRKWLSVDEKNHIYLKEGKEIGIYEYNVDAIKERTLTVNRDGELKNLKEGQDYTAEVLENRGKWKQNYYKIKAENFEKEGNYTIILNSKDNADNSMNNTSVKRKAEPLPLSFTVDRTPPTILVSGVEDKGKYQSAAKELVVEVTDNLALEGLDIQIGDRKIHYGKEELKENNGIVKEPISKDRSWQEIRVSAIDAAKNKQEERLQVLIAPASLQKEKSQNDRIKVSMAVVLFLLLLFIWKKKKGCFILKENTDRKRGSQ
ncbi:MAG: hypothetical protein Q4C84_06580 [Bacillota bacterium]|nr:hypothetical protein [Bacillota bacterium]